MNTCFVMQPFDHGVFDQRYEDIIKPAIEEAGLEAYRVDQDPKVSIPITDIESGIRKAAVCLAEITNDNPNVWYELGYAFACGKQVVMICSEERTSKFPFDIQHRTIIRYQIGSRQVLNQLQSDITTKVKAYFEKVEKIATVSEISKITKFEGLSQHEVACLATIAENLDHPSDHTSAYILKEDMEQGGFTKIASTIAVRGLLSKALISEGVYTENYNNYDEYTGYSFTESGWDWVMSNQEKFVLQKPMSKPYVQKQPIPDDDIPF